MSRSGRVSERANSFGTLVFIGKQHVVETFVADRPQEPLDVWSWEILQSIETEAGVFYQDGTADEFGGAAAFVNGYFLEGALDLDKVEGLVCDGDGGLEDGLYLGELVGVAGDEVDLVAGFGHFGGLWESLRLEVGRERVCMSDRIGQ